MFPALKPPPVINSQYTTLGALLDIKVFFKEISGIDIILEDRNIFFFYDLSFFLEKKISFVLNLFIMFGKYHIHKCRWAKSTP